MDRLWILVLLAGCDAVFLERQPLPFGEFGAPAPLDDGPVNTAAMEEDDPSLTGDLHELYFLRDADLWRATRLTTTSAWTAPALVTELNTTTTELRPSVAADGLTIYFSRGVAGDRDIYVSTRNTRAESWGAPVLLALDLNVAGTEEMAGWSSPDGRTLFVESSAGGNHDLYIATRPTRDAPFTSVPFAELNKPDSNEGGAWATEDGNVVVFESDRTGTTAIWEAKRDDEGWQIHFHAELDTNRVDGTPWLAPDGNEIIFSRTVVTDDLYRATR